MSKQTLVMAVDIVGNPRYVDDVPNGAACECFCPACNQPVVAKNEGEIRMHHFAHLSNTACEHGYQSSIHLMAKEIFLEMREFLFIKDGQPVYYRIDSVVLEKKIGSIIPDILIISDGKQFIVEIYVTHAIDKEKKQRIEELNISTIEMNLSRFKNEMPNREELRKELYKNKNVSYVYDADKKLVQAKRELLLQYGWKIQIGIGESVSCLLPQVANQKQEYHRYVPLDFCRTCPYHCADTQVGFVRCGRGIRLPAPVNPRILQLDIFVHLDKVLFSSELHKYVQDFDKNLVSAMTKLYYKLRNIAISRYGGISLPQGNCSGRPSGNPHRRVSSYNRGKRRF